MRGRLVELDRDLRATPDDEHLLDELDHLGKAADPDPWHPVRVGRLSRVVATHIGWNDERAALLERAARLHDIGKHAVRRRVLLNPGSLTSRERKHVAIHTSAAAPLLGGLHHPVLRLARTVALFHHERWDGRGYPHGTSARSIPTSARIVAVADVWDALTQDRPYRPGMSASTAAGILTAMRGTQLDPHLTDVLLNALSSVPDNDRCAAT